jgi:hypothetical protein
MSDKTQIAEWINSYGIDSDFVRVRVLIQFPRVGSTQFIANDLVERAMDQQSECDVTLYDPLIMGVDVARFGDDASVIRLRRGRDARTLPIVKLRGLDTMQVAARVAELNEMCRPDAIFVDAGGPGAGVVDRCLYLKLPVTGIDFGSRPDGDMWSANSGIRYYNKRAEMFGRLRDWLRDAQRRQRTRDRTDVDRIRLWDARWPRFDPSREEGRYEKAWSCLAR